LALSLVGCESKSFRAEREMWRAQKMAQEIFKNPKGVPPFEVNAAQEAYREIITNYPDSLFAVQARFNIGNLYLVTGEFQKARDEYGRLVTQYAKNPNLCVGAVFAVGYAYEIEGKWDEALAQYNKILKDYPLTYKGIEIPIYLIRHYRRLNDEAGTRRAVQEAVGHYYTLMGKIEAGKGDRVVAGLVVRSYTEGGQWNDALDALEKIIRDYPKDNPEEAILTKAFIYKARLNDSAKAKEELERLVRDYPQSKFAEQAKVVLKKI
jgi:tetratricopeptide (TPR) repeat protein